jgi:hypothetical protein
MDAICMIWVLFTNQPNKKLKGISKKMIDIYQKIIYIRGTAKIKFR